MHDLSFDPLLPSRHLAMYRTLAVLVVILIVLHQDNWLWTNDYLVFGVIPIGLFFHACISIAASCVWWWATKYCWPAELQEPSVRYVSKKDASP